MSASQGRKRRRAEDRKRAKVQPVSIVVNAVALPEGDDFDKRMADYIEHAGRHPLAAEPITDLEFPDLAPAESPPRRMATDLDPSEDWLLAAIMTLAPWAFVGLLLFFLAMTIQNPGVK